MRWIGNVNADRLLAGKREVTTNLENPGIDGKILLKLILNNLDKKDLDYWWSALNTVMNLRVAENVVRNC